MTGHMGARMRRPARTVAACLAALLPVAVAVGVYVFGRTHTPDYTSGLFGQHGAGVYDLKARLGSALMALAVVQLLLGLWMYRRLPGVPVRTLSPAANGGDLPRVSPVWVSPGPYSCGE
jgi:hypothetical protein